jgi:hypothetical protein
VSRFTTRQRFPLLLPSFPPPEPNGRYVPPKPEPDPPEPMPEPDDPEPIPPLLPGIVGRGMAGLGAGAGLIAGFGAIGLGAADFFAFGLEALRAGFLAFAFVLVFFDALRAAFFLRAGEAFFAFFFVFFDFFDFFAMTILRIVIG